MKTACVSRNLAAGLLGRSPRHVRELCRALLLDHEADGRISLASLEHYRGRPVTATELLETMSKISRVKGERREITATPDDPRSPFTDR